MMQPSATSASKSSLSAIASSASGISSAPGTLTWRMCLAATPSACSSARQLSASLSVSAELKRERTMPMRRSMPLMEICWPLSASCMGAVLESESGVGSDEAGHVQAVAGHARHAARPAEQLHLRDAELAQDLRADAVGTQVHLAALALGAFVGRLELADQRGHVFAAVEQQRRTALGLLQR